MLQTAERGSPATNPKPAPHELYLDAYRWMLLARVFEDKLASMYRGGMIHGGVYLGRGQEAVSVASAIFLKPGDVFAPLIRDQAGRFAFGEPVIDAARTYLGSIEGPMRGRDGNIHRGRPQEGYLAMISHLGAMSSVTAGTLLAKRMKGEKDFVGVTSIGEGGMSTGAFHEGANIAAVEGVPMVIVATNNQYAYSTPNERQFACADLVDRAKGYGYEGSSVDGTDLNACLEVIGGAIKRARAGRPPQMVVATVLRLAGHGEHDDAAYVAPHVKKAPFAQDCLKRSEQWMLAEGLADTAKLQQMRQEAAAQVEQAVAAAQAEALPDPHREDWCPLATRRLAEGLE